MAAQHDWVWTKSRPGTEEYACDKCGSTKVEDERQQFPTQYYDAAGRDLDDLDYLDESEPPCPPPGWTLAKKSAEE